ncbi:hypothetical protein G647_03511 [Cladophialophora carrionii CBS 160.54]|uniref:Uncharacterized protein n=1 Tax=Cladophialophora carrionii CBS 160.54 TaxID=1279043 RepID=V9DDV2_9EURO|nr:uncharacterized protein G647_03511 [Cladophialophora carrionii CBS 160.54]ETI24142.1 hypothetical protein G647_03511 [Cladophialophora carrionii CBS 160.54]
MASKEPQPNTKSDLITKDAMYLFEMMRDSPQPILLYIAPYAVKTGTKANTIVKRLGEIKKRNGLNIITTTSPPGDIKSHAHAAAATARPRASKPRQDGTKSTVKCEKKPAAAKSAQIIDSNNKFGDLKAEESNSLSCSSTSSTSTAAAAAATAAHGLPSPADFTPGKWTASTSRPAAIGRAVASTAGVSPSQMPLYMPQKRAFSHVEADSSQYVKSEDNAIKKVKTETWSFDGSGNAITTATVS